MTPRPVALGFAGAFVKTRRARNSPPGSPVGSSELEERDTAFICKVGGVAVDWEGRPVPELQNLRCPTCSSRTVLLTQLYSPVPVEDDPEFEIDRTLFLLGCNASGRCGFFCCIRIQRNEPVFIGDQGGPSGGSQGSSCSSSSAATPAAAATVNLSIDECFGGADSGFGDSEGFGAGAFDFGGWDKQDPFAAVPAAGGSSGLGSLDSLLAAHEQVFSPSSPHKKAPASPPPPHQQPQNKASPGGSAALPKGAIKPFHLDWEDEPAGLSGTQRREQAHAERLLQSYRQQEEELRQRQQAGGAAAGADDESWGDGEQDDDSSSDDEDEDGSSAQRPRRIRRGQDAEEGLVLRFQERLRRAPEQIVRFQPGGQPLYVGSTASYRPPVQPNEPSADAAAAESPEVEADDAKSGDPPQSEQEEEEEETGEQSCAGCGSPVRFEFQLMPYFFSATQVRSLAAMAVASRGSKRPPSADEAGQQQQQTPEQEQQEEVANGMDWTMLDVYACSASCTSALHLGSSDRLLLAPEVAAERGYQLVTEHPVEVQAPLL